MIKKFKHFILSKYILPGIVSVLLLAVFYYLYLTIAIYGSDYGNFYGSLKRAYGMHAIKTWDYAPGQTKIELHPDHDPFFSIPFENTISLPCNVILTLKECKNIENFELFLGFQGKSYASKYKKNGFILPQRQNRGADKTLKIKFSLPEGNYNALRFDFDSFAKKGDLIISNLEISPYPLAEFFASFFISMVIACILIIPGTLLYALISSDDNGTDRYLISFFALSILFYLALFLLLEFLLALDMATGSIMLAAFISSLLILGFLTYLKQKCHYTITLIKKSAKELTIYLGIVLVSFYIIIFGVDQPLAQMNFTDISWYKTCKAFTAHDNMFQYVNGKAIANNEPFAKYYANRALFYNVQDREMLPGALYAVFRKIAGGCSPLLEDSYFIYTIIGTCMNIMVIFPLIVLFRIYFGDEKIFQLTICLSLNTFVIINYYFTWYKFAGAALFLSALIFLIADYTRMKNWLLAGFFFGLSVNLHAGNALGIPLFFLWFSYQNIKIQKQRPLNTYLAAAGLVIVFFVMNLPWSIVKRLYFSENHALINEHFLKGFYSSDTGMFRSVILFFQSIPLTEQITTRFNNLRTTLRLSEIQGLMSLSGQLHWKQYWLYRSLTEFSFVLHSISALLLFSVASRFCGSKCTQIAPQDNNPFLMKSGTLLGLCGLTCLLVTIAYFGRNDADLTWQHPMGILLIIFVILIGYILKSEHVSKLFYLYLGFTALRLAFSLFGLVADFHL